LLKLRKLVNTAISHQLAWRVHKRCTVRATGTILITVSWFGMSTIPNWLVAVDGSSGKDVGGVGAYLLCDYSEAKAVVLQAKQEYERRRPGPEDGDKQRKQQKAEVVARDILKNWAKTYIVAIPPERTSDRASVGSTAMEVKTAVAALEDLLQRARAPGAVVLVTDCETQTAKLGSDGNKQGAPSGEHTMCLQHQLAQLERVGGSLTTKKVDGHGPTKLRMQHCSVEGGDLLGHWEGLVFFAVDMAARKSLRALNKQAHVYGVDAVPAVHQSVDCQLATDRLGSSNPIASDERLRRHEEQQWSRRHA